MKLPGHGLLMLVLLFSLTGCADVTPVRGPAIGEVLSASRGRWQTAERLTRGAGTEYQADYHAATDRLVYVSERTDGAELYVQQAPRVPLQPAHPIAAHSARDLWPRFSPDGDSVVFVSARSDTAGDLWRYDRSGWLSGLLTGWLFSGEPRRLTDEATSDDQPCWHPDGRRIVYSSAEQVGAPYDLWMLGPDGTRERLTEEGGQMPDCSPDGRHVVFVSQRDGGNADLWVLRLSDRRVARLTGGPALDLYPCWSADGTRVFFVRCEFDTTGDGRLDLDDATSVFSVSFDEAVFEADDRLPPARQLTSYGTSESFPRPMGDGFLFTRAASAGGADIYALGPTGQMPNLRTVEAFLAFARKVDDEGDIYRRQLAWQNAVWADRASEGSSARVAAEARLGLGRVYREMGRVDEARAEFADLVENDPDAPVAVGRARVELLALKRRSMPLEAEDWESHLESARGLENEYSQFASGAVGGQAEQFRTIAAEALLEVGRSELARGRPAEALEVLESVAVRYPEEERVCAEALLATAEVYRMLEEPGALVDAYLDVLERYPEQEPAAVEAARRAVDVMVRPEAGFEDRLSGLRQLVEDYRGVPVLPALAQNAIGDLFYSRKEYLEALEQYRQTIEEFPDDTAQAAAAHLAVAHIHVEQQDFDRAVDVLRDLRERYGRSGGRMAERARGGLVRSLLLKAQHEKDLGDFGLAADTYATLLEVEPDSVAAVRGMVEASARLGRIEDAIIDYRERVRQNPTDHRAHYALALGYSYYGPEDWVGRSGLTRRRTRIDRRAIELIDRAITLEPDISYYHQLRGFLLNRLALATDKTEPKLRALDAYLTALGLGSREDDPVNYANLLFNVGEGYTLIERPDAAFDYYRRALEAG
ncbi:MAG: tetratricopeptide repeat protein, partial [Candidatus Brocadiia bacterium]